MDAVDHLDNTISREIFYKTLHPSFIYDQRISTYKTITTVDHFNTPLTYEVFFRDYLLANRPCIMGKFLTDKWSSRQDWVTSDGSPNVKFLSKMYGSVKVPVADCRLEKYCSHPKEEMTVSDYILCISQKPEQNMYLKDWHFTRDFPDYCAYELPSYFHSDWLNKFWDTRRDECDDYRFVYFGTKGTWTPFHVDVFRSYSWSANVCGRKKWILLPPGEEMKLADHLGELPFDLTSDDTDLQDNLARCKKFEVIQEAGEVIFVPSGWHHQVFNLEDTISINHNWINGCNIDLSWTYIKDCLRAVEKEIADCKDMEGWNQQCQLILKASSGIDYKEFLKFLSMIAYASLKHMELEDSIKDAPDRDRSEDGAVWHILFDLNKINNVLTDMLQKGHLDNLDSDKDIKQARDLLWEIQNVLSLYTS